MKGTKLILVVMMLTGLLLPPIMHILEPVYVGSISEHATVNTYPLERMFLISILSLFLISNIINPERLKVLFTWKWPILKKKWSVKLYQLDFITYVAFAGILIFDVGRYDIFHYLFSIGAAFCVGLRVIRYYPKGWAQTVAIGCIILGALAWVIGFISGKFDLGWWNTKLGEWIFYIASSPWVFWQIFKKEFDVHRDNI